MIRIMNGGNHPEELCSIRDRLHGVGGIPHQVQNNLLQLALMGEHQWKLRAEPGLDDDVLCLQLDTHEPDETS